MNYDLIIFDLDGTLVDSLPDIAAALNHGLTSLGRAPVAPSEVGTLVGEGVLRLAEKALTLRPVPGMSEPPALAETLATRIRAYYRSNPCVHSRLYPGIPELLRSWRASPGRKLAVVTNKPADIARPLLDALGVAASFEAIVGDGDGYPRKPDPTAGRALLSRFSSAPARSLVVGDGVPDLLLAAALGCDSAAALWGYGLRADLEAHGPTFRCEAPSDLLTLEPR